MLNEKKINKLTKEEAILEILTIIIERLDNIEEKIDQQNDPHNLKRLKLSTLPSTMPNGYTLIDSTRTY